MLKCPSCGSNVRFDIATQKLHCDFCSKSFAPTLFDSLQKDASLQEGQEGSQPGDSGLYEAAVWTCPGCGAVLTYTDDTDITSVCSYCGGRNIMFERIRGERRPDNIVPFSVTKDKCIQEYTKQARRAFLSPGYLRSKSQVESFRGIYMPYFDYYAKLDSSFSITTEKLNRDASSSDTRIYDTNLLEGYVTGKVLGKSHDASVRFSDDISENLGDFGRTTPFSPGYLSGFYAETDDAGLETHLPSDAEVWKKIQEAMLNEVSTHPELASDFGNSSIGTVNINSLDLTPSKVYAERTLYPVWFMSHRMKNGKLTYAAVNGSSGRVVADFPMSFLKVVLFALGAGLLYFLFFNLIKLMPRPVPALCVTLLLFMFGSIFNSFTLEKKLKRLNPGYNPRLIIPRMGVLGGFGLVLTIAVLPSLVSDSNNIWTVLILFVRPLFVAFHVLSLFLMFNLIKGIDMEEMRVTHKELRLARWIPIVHLVVSYVVSLVSLIILLTQPRNEVYYYMAVANAVAFMGLFVFTVLVNNYFSYRRPLQFNKKGGDDNAN